MVGKKIRASCVKSVAAVVGISQITAEALRFKGQLISEPKDWQSSSINIYCGMLEATNGVQNKTGSTLAIGALDGKMGQIQGSVNNQGNFIVDVLDANVGELHTNNRHIHGQCTKIAKWQW